MKDKDRMMLDMRRHYEYKNFQDVLEQAKSLTASLSTEDLKYTEDEASSRNYDSDEDQEEVKKSRLSPHFRCFTGYKKARPKGRAGKAQQQPETRRMQSAEICGGRLMVIAPLYSTRMRSPTRKRQALAVKTTTSWPVEQS